MSVDERAAALLARLDREVARAEAGTVAVGGITKAGNDLEALLKAAVSAYYKGQGSSLEAELRRRDLKSGAGTYARLLKDANPAALGNVIAQAIARDVRLPRSRVLALVDLRNANAHGSADPKTHKATLAAVASLLRPLLPRATP